MCGKYRRNQCCNVGMLMNAVGTKELYTLCSVHSESPRQMPRSAPSTWQANHQLIENPLPSGIHHQTIPIRVSRASGQRDPTAYQSRSMDPVAQPDWQWIIYCETLLYLHRFATRHDWIPLSVGDYKLHQTRDGNGKLAKRLSVTRDYTWPDTGIGTSIAVI